MRCPRCDNEWNVSKSPCPRCGLFVRLPAIFERRETQAQDQEYNATNGHMPALSPLSPSPLKDRNVRQPNPETPPVMPPPSLPSQLPESQAHIQEIEKKKTSSPLRPKRLVTAPLEEDDLEAALQLFPPDPALSDESTISIAQLEPLEPGTPLHDERYHLQKIVERQEWLAGVTETTWLAQDAQRRGTAVTIVELGVPNAGLLEVQALLRNATIALTSVGRHARIPTLWDVFGEGERHFFVFEPMAGESLCAKMQRLGRPLVEHEVLDCCLQITELLNLLSQLVPPLVHGLIRPEHILVNANATEYILTNFSLVLAGQATQFITGIEHTQLSPYSAPDFSLRPADPRWDLYAVLGSAYHLLTGSIPVIAAGGQSVRPVRELTPGVSFELSAILEKGLSVLTEERYQSVAALREDLLLVRAGRNGLSQSNPLLARVLRMQEAEQEQRIASSQKVDVVPAVVQMSPGKGAPLATTRSDGKVNVVAQRSLVFRPEKLDLLPAQLRSDIRFTLFWALAIVLCLLMLWLMGRIMS